MLSQIGFFSLSISLIFNFINVFCFKFINKRWLDYFFKINISLGFVFIIFSFISLIVSFVISDFSNYNVFQNSHSSKPLIYKITASWGNHEGSMILWVLIMNLYSFIFLFNKNLDIITKKYALVFQSLQIIIFCLFIILTSNPFLLNPIEAREGLGFNPILQDPAVAIHPPLLYIGYVGFSLILSLSLAGLITNKCGIVWSKVIKKWVIFAWSMLTAGIATGSYWAYYELGWGGWWFWDPVENASLMPWLAGLALLHTLIISEQNDLLKRWTIFLSILCFSLSLIGTFLVRSGILTSVHAFANDSSRGIFLLLIFLVITGFSFMLFIIKSPKNNQSVQILLINKTTAIIVNNIIMITACFTILLGTIYPIIIESLINQRISVGAPYFNSTVLPIMLPGLLLMSVAPVLSWQTNKLNNAPFYLYIFLAIGILMTILSILMTLNIWGIIGLFIAFYIISASIYTIISKLKKIKNTRQLKKIFIFNSSVIAHLGVGILIIGITSSSVFQKQYDKFIKINEKIQIGNYQLLLEEIEITEINNYESLTGKFSLYKNDSLIGYIYPEKRFFPVSKIITTEAGIYHSIFQDFYLVIGDNVNEGWSIKFYQNPLVLLIWVGAFIMITSSLVGILKR